MEQESEDALLIQIKRPLVRKFLNSKEDGPKNPNDRSSELTFLMASDDRGNRSYEAITLTKSPIPSKEKNKEVSRIKLGSWRAEVKRDESSLTMKSSERNKVEIVRGILNDLIVNIKSEEGIHVSAVSSYQHINISDKLRMNRIKKQQEQRFKGKVTRRDQCLSKCPRLSSVVKECGLAGNIFKTDPTLETKTQLDRVSLRSSTSIRSVSLEVPLPQEVSEEETSISDVDLKDTQKLAIRPPFELKWCFGFDSDVPIVNLSTDDRSFVLFANSQFSVLFDFHKQTMNFLQGHHNSVTSIAADSLGALMVTADSGSNSRVIVWDTRPCVVKVLEDVHPRGTRLVGLSTYAEYLVTVSPAPEQTVQLWHYEHKLPAAVKLFSDSLGEIKKLAMNINRAEEFSLISDAGVTFVLYKKEYSKEVNEEGELIFDSHQTPLKLGTVTGTTFLYGDAVAALTSTSKGYVIVWAEEEIQLNKVYKKHVHLQFESIVHIEVVDGLVALATVSGNVSFYDLELKILYWIKLEMGGLKCISFNLTPQVPGGMLTCDSDNSCAPASHNETQELVDATLQNNPIRVRHFITCSESGQLAYFNPIIGCPKNIFYPSPADFTAISIHPKSHYFCAGTSLGHCIIFDFDDHEMKVSQKLSVAESSCQAVAYLQYSPSGFQLACGMYTGVVWLLHPLFLTPAYLKPLAIGSHRVTHLLFSPDSNFLAVGDAGSVVTLFSTDGDPTLLGQYQAHNRSIADLLFVNHNSKFKLLSLGTDRFIVEFHIENSTEAESKNLVFKMAHRVEQTEIPRCILRYPLDDNYFLIINSDLKFKLLDVHSLKCHKTLQAPNLGFSITFMESFSSEKENKQYLLFGSEKHIGIHMLPVDGNPYKALAYQASPTSIVSCKVHRHGKYVFIVCEGGKSIDMWEVNAYSLEQHFKSGGEGMEPFWNMLEGGKGGWREREIREFFTVGRFAHQGERPGVLRSPTDSLHVCEITSVFQALGFFPTKYQINNLLFEVTGHDPRVLMPHFRHRVISLEQFVLLYVNHRPSQTLSLGDLQQAFRDLYQGTFFSVCEDDHFRRNTEPIFSAESFVEHLMHEGEESSYGELYAAFSMLCDKEHESVCNEHHRPTGLMSFIPQELSFDTFLYDLLGFKGVC